MYTEVCLEQEGDVVSSRVAVVGQEGRVLALQTTGGRARLQEEGVLLDTTGGRGAELEGGVLLNTSGGRSTVQEGGVVALLSAQQHMEAFSGGEQEEVMYAVEY